MIKSLQLLKLWYTRLGVVLVILLNPIIISAQSDTIFFPDKVFESELIRLYDVNENNLIEVEEISNVTKLSFTNRDISNLSGLEYFVNLEYLQLSSIYAGSFDFNKLTKLKTLKLGDIGIRSINIDSLKNLRRLELFEIFDSLNLKNNLLIDTLGIGSMNIENIKASPLNNLKFLSYNSNQPISINSISKFGAPEELVLSGNFTNDSIVYNGLESLKIFRLSGINVSSIKLGKKANLSLLEISFPQDLQIVDLSEVDSCRQIILSHNPNLSQFITNQNLFCEILDINGPSDLSLELNHLDDLRVLRIIGTQNPHQAIMSLSNLEDLTINSAALTSFAIDSFPNLKKLGLGSQNLTNLSLNNAPKLKELSLASIEKLQSLELNYLESLEVLELKLIRNISSLELNNLTRLKDLTLDDIWDLDQLTIQNLPLLQKLDVFSGISQIDIKGCENLEFLDISSFFESAQIVLDELPSIKDLRINQSGTDTVFAEIKALGNISRLNLRGNLIFNNDVFSQIESVDVLLIWKNDLAEDLDLSLINGLKEIDLNRVPNLKNLNILGLNHLNKIELDKVESLEELNLTNLPSLEIFRFTGGAMESLEIENLSNLRSLTLGHTLEINRLTLNNLDSLKFLNVNNIRKLDTLVITSLPSLEELVITTIFDLNHLHISNLKSLETIWLTGFDFLSLNDIEEVPNLKSINLRSIDFLQRLDLSKFPKLDYFKIDKVYTPNLDFTLNHYLDFIWISEVVGINDIRIENIDSIANVIISACEDLQSISIKNVGLVNRWTNNIDISFNPNLDSIRINTRGIGKIRINSNEQLEKVSIESEDINSDLTFSGNPRLEEIDLLKHSGIKSLEIEDCSILNQVLFVSNSMKDLSLSNTPLLRNIRFDLLAELRSLEINRVGIRSLDISNSNHLTFMYLDGVVCLKEIDFPIGITFQDLNIRNVGLTELDFSKVRIKQGSVGYLMPNLRNIYIKNDFLDDLHIQDFGSNIEYICVDEFETNEYLGNNYFVNSSCDYVSDGTFYRLRGNSRYSTDSICNEIDSVIAYLPLTIKDADSGFNLIKRYSDHVGKFDIPLDKERRSILTVDRKMDDIFEILNDNIITKIDTSIFTYTQDVCLMPKTPYNDLSIKMIPLDDVRPGFETSFLIKVNNVGNQISKADCSFSFDTSTLELISSSEIVNISGDFIHWETEDLRPFEEQQLIVRFRVNSPMDEPPLLGGEQLAFIASINSLIQDQNLSNNIKEIELTVVNSFDPNDKTCLEGNVISPDKIGDPITYRIRFENLGTASAINIVIVDSLDTNVFDPSTFEFVSASHDVTSIDFANGVIKFTFKGINLPYQDEYNDGFVVFTIESYNTLLEGDQVTNRADIYFDYNFPILTNLESTTYKNILSNSEEEKHIIKVYPNPTLDFLYIDKGQLLDYTNYQIIDLNGRVVEDGKVESKIDIRHIIPGTFILNIINQNHVISSNTFIKLD